MKIKTETQTSKLSTNGKIPHFGFLIVALQGSIRTCNRRFIAASQARLACTKHDPSDTDSKLPASRAAKTCELTTTNVCMQPLYK